MKSIRVKKVLSSIKFGHAVFVLG